MKNLLLFVYALFVIIYGAFSYGFILHKTYYWFIFPYYENLPSFTILNAIGINLFINVLISHNNGKELKDEYYKESTLTYNVMEILKPWIMLLTCYVIKLILF